MKTTIAVSRDLVEELMREKERLEAKSIDETIRKILREYRELRRRVALEELIEKNREERRVEPEELIEDRRVWGKPRELS